MLKNGPKNMQFKSTHKVDDKTKRDQRGSRKYVKQEKKISLQSLMLLRVTP